MGLQFAGSFGVFQRLAEEIHGIFPVLGLGGRDSPPEWGSCRLQYRLDIGIWIQKELGLLHRLRQMLPLHGNFQQDPICQAVEKIANRFHSDFVSLKA